MTVQDKLLVRAARLNTQIETSKKLIARQMKQIESEWPTTVTRWIMLANLARSPRDA